MSLNFATVTIPTLLLWALGLLVFLAGGLLGYFNMAIDARKKAESADLKVENAREEARKKFAEAEQLLKEAQALGAQVPRAGNGATLLKVMEGEDFRMRIEMDGKPLSAPLTPERRKRLIELINQFRPWIEGGTTPSPQTVYPAPAPPLGTQQTPLEPVFVPEPESTLRPVPAILTLTPQKPKTDPETEFKLLSMVKQIDFVLQKRIAGSPLEPLGIHLNDAIHGGLEVTIGSKKFETIDDVPDENIRAAIRAAIAEWEEKYVPGA